MGRHRDERNRVLGPTWLPSRKKWRCIAITPLEPGAKSGGVPHLFDSETKAQRFKIALETNWKRLSSTTIEEAITLYEHHLNEKGTGAISYQETTRRLRLFFLEPRRPLSSFTTEQGRECYDTFRRRLKDDGTPISAAYHRATLINARSMFSWCVEVGYVSTNPLAVVKGIGKRKAGKTQLTIDEGRRLWRACEDDANGSGLRAQSALAMLLIVSMGLRKSDITRRVVRDVDADGTLLRVYDAKTKASNRPREVATSLQTLLRALAKGRHGDEPLFKSPYTDDGFYGETWIGQALAKTCDRIGVPVVCPHSLKGLAGTVLADLGKASDEIAGHLSHESAKTTKKHYIAPGALETAQRKRGLRVIAGGKTEQV